MSSDKINAVSPTDGTLDKTWEQQQIKTFTKWCNAKLKGTGFELKSIVGDELSDGIALAKLLSSISGETLKVNMRPNTRIHKLENLNKGLEFLKSKNINLLNISSVDICDCNPKLILGMIWTIILRFSIEELGIEGRTAREGLLLWCKRRVGKYNIDVDNFSRSWLDGRAYAALVHSQNPEALDYEKVLKLTPKERTEAAFQSAHKCFGITPLLDVEDVILANGPDEKSNVTYVAQFFHAFSEKSNVERAARRATKFANSMATITDLSNKYEEHARSYICDIDSVTKSWAETKFTGVYSQIISLRQEFRSYRSSSKRSFVSRKNQLVAELSAIQTKTALYRFNPYVPPKDLLPVALSNKHSEMLVKESEYLKILHQKAEEIIDRLLVAYSNVASAFSNYLTDRRVAMTSLSGSVEKQKTSADALLLEIKAKKSQSMPEIEKIWADCCEARLEDNIKIKYTCEDLVFEYDELEYQLNKTIGFIIDQINLGAMSNITEAQYSLYQSTFRQFDKDDNSNLNLIEFKAALNGLGVLLPEEQLEKDYHLACEGNKEVSLVGFVSYMRRFEEDESSSFQIMDAFKTIAGGKDYVLATELQKHDFSKEEIEIFTKKMEPYPGVEGAYDYSKYVKTIYKE